MRMLFIFCPGSGVDHARNLIDVHDLHAWTQLPHAAAQADPGSTAPRHAQRGTASVILTAVPEPKVAELSEALEAFNRTCAKGESVRVFQVPVERLV